MIKKFIPEYYLDTFDLATPEFLTSIGVRGVIVDVDNTLEPYENPEPGAHVVAWLEGLNSVGISASIVSNNSAERIELFNKGLGLPAYYKSGKPFKKSVLRAMSDMGTSVEDTILIGDQVFTDVLAAHNAGIRAILVPPIKDKRDLFTRLKRWMEKPVLRRYYKEKKKENNDEC